MGTRAPRWSRCSRSCSKVHRLRGADPPIRSAEKALHFRVALGAPRFRPILPSAMMSHGFDAARTNPAVPLNVVLLPGGDLPLHIFEPRYRQMVQTASKTRASSECFCRCRKGVVRVGCTAEIPEVASATTTGEWIFSPSAAPVSHRRTVNADQYGDEVLLEGKVDYLDDRERPVDPENTTRTDSALRGLPHDRLWRLSAKRGRRWTGRACLTPLRHAADGIAVEAAGAGAAIRSGSPGAPGHVPARVGAASTEDRDACASAQKEMAHGIK